MRLVSSPALIPRSLSDSLWAGQAVFAECVFGSAGLVSYAYVDNEGL